MTATSAADSSTSDEAATNLSSPPPMSKGITLGLSRVLRLLDTLGQPQLAVPIIHVAGTNGKGSVCAYIDSILRKSGLRVGRFTSPHLVHVRDSITLDGSAISETDFKKAQNAVEAANAKHHVEASPFELLAATAFQSFKDQDPPLDLAVVEVGMGGSTDATNVCPHPLVTVITAIDMDHQAFLGNTVEEIANVKAGIIKASHPCILAPQAHEGAVSAVTEMANRLGAPLTCVDKPVENSTTFSFRFKNEPCKVNLPLLGSYQAANAATAVAAIEALCSRTSFGKVQCITAESVKQGLESTRWPGRLDWVEVQGKKMLLDGAHNPASIDELAKFLTSLPPPTNTTLIVGLSSPRDPATLLHPLFTALENQEIRVIATGFSQPEGMPWVTSVSPVEIAKASARLRVQAEFTRDIESAMQLVQARLDDRVVVCGSLYLIADVYRLIDKNTDT